MTDVLISFVSLTGSPGLSTAALALTWCWPRHAVVAECDPTGGRALAVFDPDGRHGRPGVFELMLQARTTPIHRAMAGQLLVLPDGTGRHHLLPGATSPLEADSLDWRRLTSLFLELGTVDVLADCGRLRSRSAPAPVVAASDLVVVVVRNCRGSLQALVKAVDLIRAETGVVGDGLCVLVIEPDPRAHQRFPRGEIAKQFAGAEMPVIGGLSWDPASAAQFSELHRPGRRFATSALLGDAHRVAGEIGRRALERTSRLRRPLVEVRHGR
ncbi:MinD/ParA family protein [Amycolatopsis sp. cmx-4-83]|uniref:MinD/ParA family ATP-binding protein n=1 Tax=Amycolatopsis sp. cmx-4-83 TaxID=2790940 RepID=UPI00397CFB1A